jgi:hypothetical protein
MLRPAGNPGWRPEWQIRFASRSLPAPAGTPAASPGRAGRREWAPRCAQFERLRVLLAQSQARQNRLLAPAGAGPNDPGKVSALETFFVLGCGDAGFPKRRFGPAGRFHHGLNYPPGSLRSRFGAKGREPLPRKCGGHLPQGPSLREFKGYRACTNAHRVCPSLSSGREPPDM